MKKLYMIITLSILFSIIIKAEEGVQLLGELNPHSSQGYNDIWGYAADGREYALLCAGGGTSIIDITDPNNPAEVSFISGPFSGWRDVKTHGTYAYVITEGAGEGKGLQIIDLSDLPNSAALVNTVDEYFNTAHNIFIDDGYAYVIGTDGGGGMHILDLSDPVNPTRTAYYTTSAYIHDVYVWSDTVVACAATTYDLVDVSDKSNPQLISSSAALPGIYAHSGWMTEDKRYFIAAEEFNERDITVWDLEDRENWKLVMDGLKLSNDSPIHNIFVKGDYAHISYYKEGYIVLDISDPINPLVVDQYDTYPSSNGYYDGAWGCYPYLPSGNIIVSDMATGLYIFSFNPVENPAPFLSHNYIGQEVSGEVPVELNLSVLDDDTVPEVLLYYRTTSNDQTSDWITVNGNDLGDGSEFEFTIPAQQHLTEVDYYFAARDNGGKITTLPEGGSGDPPGANPPEDFYSYVVIDAGIPIITALSHTFTDTTIVKGESIDFSAEAIDTSSLELSYSWFVNGQKKSSNTEYSYGTAFVFSTKTDTVTLNVSNGYNQISRSWLITVDIASDVEDGVPLSYSLNQNYPNPFNPSTKISYSIPEAANVKLNIYNAIGELVSTLVDNYKTAGKYEVNFNAAELSSGFYIAQIVTQNFTENIKMLLVK